MRMTLLTLLCLAGLSCAKSQQGGNLPEIPPLKPAVEVDERPPLDQKKFSIQGHRGAAAIFPENTLPGFEYALSVGADQLELDIQISLDGVPVVFHDAQVSDRVCRHRGGKRIDNPLPIRTLTLEQIKRFDCGFQQAGGIPIYTAEGARIPTFEEVVRLVRSSKMSGAGEVIFKLDIKSEDQKDFYYSPKQIAGLLVSEITRLKVGHRVIYASFDERVLAEIKALNPLARLAYLFDGLLTSRIIDIARILGVHTVSPRATFLFAQGEVEWIARLKNEGFKVVPWTVNKPRAWKRLIDAGIDGILTDDPGTLAEFYAANYGHPGTR